MINEIELEKLKEEHPEFFQKTPPEIIDFIFSEKTSSQIAEICMNNGVGDEEKIEEIASRVVWAILGRLPKENLYITLEKGVGLGLETARKISDEINKNIFSQMPVLEKKDVTKKEIMEEKPKISKKDVYRELIE